MKNKGIISNILISKNSCGMNGNKCDLQGVSGSFLWSTDYYHNDNAFTMTDFLDNHLSDDVEIHFEDGSYAEVRIGKTIYSLDAKGNGDSYNHIIEWSKKQ